MHFTVTVALLVTLKFLTFEVVGMPPSKATDYRGDFTSVTQRH